MCVSRRYRMKQLLKTLLALIDPFETGDTLRRAKLISLYTARWKPRKHLFEIFKQFSIECFRITRKSCLTLLLIVLCGSLTND